MSKNIPPKARKFLEKANATPTESEIYLVALKQYAKLDRPLRNCDILIAFKSRVTKAKTHRTNIRAHLSRMIGKGLIKRHTHQFYLPIE